MDNTTTQPFPSAKPNLVQLLNFHRITMIHLAYAARVRPVVIYAMVVGIAISPSLADQILQAFSQLAGRQYTLAQVNIALQEQER